MTFCKYDDFISAISSLNVFSYSGILAIHSGGSSVSQNKLPRLILGYSYLHFKIPSKQLHWLDFILLKFITYDIVLKLF